LETWVQEGLQPDATLLFDVPVHISMQRLQNARSPDKFERESSDFFRQIRETYLLRAQQDPQRFHIINADRPLDAVKKTVEEIIANI
ncbi:MAG TPA: dTMP kinase, partial [Methylophilaceae bacterium]|nr:dTMP kinase [Methylophilaceae bacterium]